MRHVIITVFTLTLVASISTTATAQEQKSPCSTDEMSQLGEVLENLNNPETILAALQNAPCDWERPFAEKAQEDVGSQNLYNVTLGMADSARTVEGCIAAAKTADSEPAGMSTDYVGGVGGALRECFRRNKKTGNVLLCSKVAPIWQEYCALGMTSSQSN